jgi:hypothetical protein
MDNAPSLFIQNGKMSAAWQVAWDYLAEGEKWRPHVIDAMVREGVSTESSAKEVLLRAVKAGYVEVTRIGRMKKPYIQRAAAEAQTDGALSADWKEWADSLSPEARAKVAAHFQDRLDEAQANGDQR